METKYNPWEESRYRAILEAGVDKDKIIDVLNEAYEDGYIDGSVEGQNVGREPMYNEGYD